MKKIQTDMTVTLSGLELHSIICLYNFLKKFVFTSVINKKKRKIIPIQPAGGTLVQ